MANPANGPTWAVSPMEWGAQIDYDTWTDVYTPDDGIALHHGGGTNYPAGVAPYTEGKEIAQLRSWESYHLSKGWRGIAYGWAIGQTGKCYRLRGWSTYGAHTGDVDGDGISNNAEIIPVLFIGSGNHVDMSPAAKATFVALRKYLNAESGRSLYLYGHQEVQGTSTTCPGPILMNYVKANRILVEEDELTPEEKAALAYLVAALNSTNADTPSWGGAFWSKFKALWSPAPGPASPVSHLQLAYVWDKLNSKIDGLEVGAGLTIDEIVEALQARLED